MGTNITPLGVTHGTSSPRLLSRKMEDVAAELFASCPWVLESDAPAIEQYVRACARWRMLDEYVQTVMEEQGVNRVPPYLLREVTAAERNAMAAADALGLTPQGRIKLTKNGAMVNHFSQGKLNSLVARGRRMRSG